MVGDLLVELDRPLHLSDPAIEIADPVDDSGVAREAPEDLLVLANGLIELAFLDKLFSVLQDLVPFDRHSLLKRASLLLGSRPNAAALELNSAGWSVLIPIHMVTQAGSTSCGPVSRFAPELEGPSPRRSASPAREVQRARSRSLMRAALPRRLRM